MLQDRQRAAIDAMCTLNIGQDARDLPADLHLADRVDPVLADAATVLDRFLGRLQLAAGAIVAAENILSHDLWDYVRHVRAAAGVGSVTPPIGKGLEVSRFATNAGTHPA